MTVDAIDAVLAQQIDEIVTTHEWSHIGVVSEDTIPKPMRRRRGFVAGDYDGLASLSLLRVDGVLRWSYEPPADDPTPRVARRARRGDSRIGADVVRTISFRETPPNQVIGALATLDEQINPVRGLRMWDKAGKKLVPAANVPSGRVLLLVHGTFSKSDMYVTEFAAAGGRSFIERAANTYAAVLFFDHPTLSISPWINALDLEMAMAGIDGPVDVICHSRGGLVVAWWLRNSKRNVANVIFVGSPLGGTSLASPASLRAALDFLVNVVKAITAAATVAGAVAPITAPLMMGVAGLAKILGGVLQLGSSTPLLDAAIAVVPGLNAQSRVGNNAELERLMRAPWVSTPTCCAIMSNFEPDTGEWWQFWKKFHQLPTQAANLGADLIFKDNNDLVVDTVSMTQMCGTVVPTLHDFGTSSTVHHVNYFRQPETVRGIASKLGVP